MNKLMIAAALLAVPGLAAAQSIPAKRYVAKAGASDQYELQSSRLVLATTRDGGVRRFAEGMIRDHTKSTADVKRAALRSHVVAGPPHLDPMGARNIAQLRRARGPARDALYIQQQKASHRDALNLHQDYANSGDAPALRRTAGMIVPVVQHHIDELSRM